MLRGTEICYYATDDWKSAREPRGTFTLMKGCFVGEINEIPVPKAVKKTGEKGEVIYSFSIIWPVGSLEKKRKNSVSLSDDESVNSSIGKGKQLDQRTGYASDEDNISGKYFQEAIETQSISPQTVMLPNAMSNLYHRASSQATHIKERARLTCVVEDRTLKHHKALKKAGVVAGVTVGSVSRILFGSYLRLPCRLASLKRT